MSQLILAENKTSAYTIVVSATASPSERHAAKELQTHLKKISGALLPLRDDSGPLETHDILVGFNAHTREAGVSVQPESLGTEGYRLCTAAQRLLILGGPQRGVLYGVYAFLEEVLGCRWFTPTVSRIPRRDRVEVAPMDKTYLPPLEYRDPYYVDAFNGDWAARNQVNGYHVNAGKKHGGCVSYAGFVHTFDTLLPVSEFYDEHPEYYALIDGKRVRENTQPCLTNPAVFDIVLDRVRQRIRENPQAAIVSVSQNDNYNYCQCDACRALDEQEESHAGTILAFVNRIAAVLAEEYPDLIVDTLAYQYTRKPPKTIRPLPNVAVRLCSIECCFSHPMEECQEVAAFREKGFNNTFQSDLEGWASICDRLYIWDYVTNFRHYLLPFPNFKVMQPNIQFFIRNHVRGVFEEGNYAVGGGEFSQLRQYVLAKLLWNPDYDVELAVEEFLTAYYSMSAPWVRRYIDWMQQQVAAPDRHISFHDAIDSPYLSDAFVRTGKELLEQALRVADNEKVRRRVQTLYLGLRQIEIARLPEDDPTRDEQIGAFRSDLLACGITELQEGVPLETTLQEMRHR